MEGTLELLRNFISTQFNLTKIQRSQRFPCAAAGHHLANKNSLEVVRSRGKFSIFWGSRTQPLKRISALCKRAEAATQRLVISLRHL